ncbi:hypothetical protein JCM6882_001025 [Rhodosporidiobolus microsporus]
MSKSWTSDHPIATIAFGWVLGFVCWNCGTAWSQTHKLSAYTIMIWGEIIACFVFAVVCWLYLIEKIPHSFAFFLPFLTLWVLQVQFLLQIIINRVNLLWSDRKHQNMLKYGVAAIVLAINISVYCVWIPARLQISDTYVRVNQIWDRVEKCIYLVLDAVLNLLFIRVVQARLVNRGLERYRPLVRFNKWLILLSIGMDALIIGMMSLPNSVVYTAFHPVAYLVKLQIEMQLGALIVEISTAKPARGTVANAFDGLKIAVSTHTETTAYRLDEDAEDGAGASRATRTPARPDLHKRLEKMRRERRERKGEGEDQADVRINMGDSGRRGSDFSIDEKIEMDEWDTAVQPLPRDSHANDAGVRFVIEDYPK